MVPFESVYAVHSTPHGERERFLNDMMQLKCMCVCVGSYALIHMHVMLIGVIYPLLKVNDVMLKAWV